MRRQEIGDRNISAARIDSNKYWAAGKIAALAKPQTPCALLDMDMMIWKPLPLQEEKLVCACVEFIDKAVYPPFFLLPHRARLR